MKKDVRKVEWRGIDFPPRGNVFSNTGGILTTYAGFNDIKKIFGYFVKKHP
jgi:hypothetical protein